MDNKTKETIDFCIKYLKAHGYEVLKRDDNKVDKWVAFTQEGMDCILHGKVINDYIGSYMVRCKNGYKRYVSLKDVIDFYDSKEECYKIR